jgi:hypothetical protein
MAEESPLMRLEGGTLAHPTSTDLETSSSSLDPALGRRVNASPSSTTDLVNQSGPPASSSASHPDKDTSSNSSASQQGEKAALPSGSPPADLATSKEKQPIVSAVDDGLPALDTSWQAWLVVLGAFLGSVAHPRPFQMIADPQYSLFATFGSSASMSLC